MAISFNNELKVCGNRDNLENFKSNMAGDCENGPLSFQNIIPAPKDTPEWENEVRGGSYSYKWQLRNWGTPFDAIAPKIKDEGEYISYQFYTRNGDPDKIYDFLINKYSELDFEIYSKDDCTFSWQEIASSKGRLTKNLYMYWRCISWKNGKDKDILYKKDYLNDTLEVVEEIIFRPGEYDEGVHQWVKRDKEKNKKIK